MARYATMMLSCSESEGSMKHRVGWSPVTEVENLGRNTVEVVARTLRVLHWCPLPSSLDIAGVRTDPGDLNAHRSARPF